MILLRTLSDTWALDCTASAPNDDGTRSNSKRHVSQCFFFLVLPPIKEVPISHKKKLTLTAPFVFVSTAGPWAGDAGGADTLVYNFADAASNAAEISGESQATYIDTTYTSTLCQRSERKHARG